MGSRGPLPKNDSRRTLAANANHPLQVAQESIAPPAGLSPAATTVFAELVDGNRRAGIEIRSVDSLLYGELAQTVARRADAGIDPSQWLSLGRHALAVASALAIGPAARARLGLTAPPPAPPESQVGRILRLARERRETPFPVAD
jgi:hypothetical protein